MIAALILAAGSAAPADVAWQTVSSLMSAYAARNERQIRRFVTPDSRIGKNDIVGGRITGASLHQFIGDCSLSRVAEHSVATTLPIGTPVQSVDTWWRCRGESWPTVWRFDVVNGRVVNAYAGGPVPTGPANG